jgi:ATP-dependent RNA helicase HelY
MVAELDRQGLLPAIVFVFSRQGCDAAVGHLMADRIRLTTAAERDALARIAADHTAGLTDDDLVALRYDRWLGAFTRGVAAHHAGLLPVFKEAVEVAFAAGLVKVVFATETLALGINMPARTVVIEKLVKYNGEAHVDLTPGEYTQLTGRAGRAASRGRPRGVCAQANGLDPRAVAGLASATYPRARRSGPPTWPSTWCDRGSWARSQRAGANFAQFRPTAASWPHRGPSSATRPRSPPSSPLPPATGRPPPGCGSASRRWRRTRRRHGGPTAEPRP